MSGFVTSVSWWNMNEIVGIYSKWQNKLEIECEWIEPFNSKFQLQYKKES